MSIAVVGCGGASGGSGGAGTTSSTAPPPVRVAITRQGAYARGVHDDGSQSPVHERSNVVLVPMPDVNGASYTL